MKLGMCQTIVHKQQTFSYCAVANVSPKAAAHFQREPRSYTIFYWSCIELARILRSWNMEHFFISQ
jgi:hypothetical protein